MDAAQDPNAVSQESSAEITEVSGESGGSSAITTNPNEISHLTLSNYTYGVTERFDAVQAVQRDMKRIQNMYYRVPMFLSTRQWDRQESLKHKKFILIDLSGTLHVEDTPTPNAVQALEFLRTSGFKILFVTNTTKESQRVVHERLLRIGFQIEKSEIFTSLNASRKYIEERNLRPFFMIAEEAKEDFEGIETDNPNAVLIGLSTKDFNRETLTKAFRLIKNENAALLAIHKGRTYKTSTGMSLGPGPFAVALEFSTDKTATVLGKPEQEFFKAALKYIGCDDVKDAVMIGDDVRDDVLGAMEVGITGILVKTGKYLDKDEEKISPQVPDFVVKDFDTAVALILESVASSMAVRPNLSSAALARSIRIKRGLSSSPKSQ